MRYERVKIRRDTNTVHNRAVPRWEIPILEFIFGEDGNVEPLEVFETLPDNYPEPAEEFQRLVQCYGADPQSDIPHVAAVYGNSRTGLRALAKAIADAKLEDEEAAEEEEAPKPAPVAQRRRKSTVDSLLL